MKKIIYFLILLGLFSCNPKDCFESTGTIVQKEIILPIFDKINVGDEVSMIIKQGTIQKVVLETGDNLVNDVTVEVVNGKLFVTDNNSCNFTREYAVTKVYVTSPNITEIRSNTARNIISDGIITYPKLTLISEDFNEDALNIGDFNMHVANQTIKIISNGSSIFTINGTTVNLTIGFYSGSSRFIGSELVATNTVIVHKSTNDMLLHPINRLEGDIFSIGDVISYQHPNIINITEHYTGRLIFN